MYSESIRTVPHITSEVFWCCLFSAFLDYLHDMVESRLIPGRHDLTRAPRSPGCQFLSKERELIPNNTLVIHRVSSSMNKYQLLLGHMSRGWRRAAVRQQSSFQKRAQMQGRCSVLLQKPSSFRIQQAEEHVRKRVRGLSVRRSSK